MTAADIGNCGSGSQSFADTVQRRQPFRHQLLAVNAVSNSDFENYLDQLRGAHQKGQRLVLEVSDNVTPTLISAG